MTTTHHAATSTTAGDDHRAVRSANMRRAMRLLVLATCLAGLPAAIAAPGTDESEALPGQERTSADIVISNAVLQPLQNPSGIADGYFTIENRGRVTHLLTGIASPACGRVIARHTDQQPTDKTSSLFTHLALPHNSSLVFATGGYHFVCLGFHRDASVDGIPVTFSFLGGGQQTIAFNVAQPSPSP